MNLFWIVEISRRQPVLKSLISLNGYKIMVCLIVRHFLIMINRLDRETIFFFLRLLNCFTDIFKLYDDLNASIEPSISIRKL